MCCEEVRSIISEVYPQWEKLPTISSSVPLFRMGLGGELSWKMEASQGTESVQKQRKDLGSLESNSTSITIMGEISRLLYLK